jgi:hypothetical protein
MNSPTIAATEPRSETIQLMSILFVTAFVALLAWTYLVAGQRGRPAGAA